MNNNAKKILQIGGLSIFFMLIIIYAFFRSQDLIFGVKIKNVIIDSLPLRGKVTGRTRVENTVIEISGNTTNATNLTLNGREISINQVGNFNETIALLSGYNIINIKAKDKFGYMDEKNYQINH
ncbi:hypothetical protein EXS45_00015 [Candidatus Nomurabacteria bacterium]|nr:hypothetical protein [Candidatus Nomurabacteria bacterium]